MKRKKTNEYKSFNSRTPGGVRLEGAPYAQEFLRVSIHAPREGCDSAISTDPSTHDTFQFTHPGRGATVLEQWLLADDRVSIHAPREGCDLEQTIIDNLLSLFQFTHPGRGATHLYPIFVYFYLVSIHAPREGCDRSVRI